MSRCHFSRVNQWPNFTGELGSFGKKKAAITLPMSESSLRCQKFPWVRSFNFLTPVSGHQARVTIRVLTIAPAGQLQVGFVWQKNAAIMVPLMGPCLYCLPRTASKTQNHTAKTISQENLGNGLEIVASFPVFLQPAIGKIGPMKRSRGIGATEL